MANERHDVAFVAGAILGSVAGTVYGLFNAPQAGWRTRADLSGVAEELGDRLALRLGMVTAELRQLRGDDITIETPMPELGYAPVDEPVASHGPEPETVQPREGATIR